MKNVSTILILILCPLFLKLTGTEPPPGGNWKCTALDPRTLALSGDCDELQQALFQQRLAVRNAGKRQPRWAVEFNFHSCHINSLLRIVQLLWDIFSSIACA